MHACLQQARSLRTHFIAFRLEGRARPSRGERPLTTVVPAAEVRGCMVTKQTAATEEVIGHPRRVILMRSWGGFQVRLLSTPTSGGRVIFVLVARRSVVSKGGLDSPTRHRGVTPPWGWQLSELRSSENNLDAVFS
ncbi:hypothetical protein VitviT2T_007108 [Vitis vinifera]|uniref:Uncharacterized protein n=1 Tax=Vitis vinifera TaxID=29760 RepID=A0ABY9BYD9_VITVI|nr:hypothetical protein VitviT2T_007108 [Vitis vinifera]